MSSQDHALDDTILPPALSADRRQTYLCGTASRVDWKQALRALEKIEAGQDPLKVLARVIAKSRYRGKAEEREALGLPTDDLYESIDE